MRRIDSAAMTRWQGATAIVTGGGSGIGRAVVRALGTRGAVVIVADIDVSAARAAAHEGGPAAEARELDVRDADAFSACVRAVIERHGRLDYLFNNAGVAVAGEAFDLPLAAWQRLIDINIRGVVNGVHAAYPVMVAQRAGHIVNTASLAGLAPTPLHVPYAMTKHAIVGLSTSLRAEAAALGVRVSVLCPAAVETPLLDDDGARNLTGNIWRPHVRRFLTRLAGPPVSAASVADGALAGVDRNLGVIVVPRRARLVWRMARLFPALVEKRCREAVAAERSAKDGAGGR